MAFSVNLGVTVPPSLQAIYRNLIHHKFIKSKPSHGCLDNWADQGVFLLNCSLTTEIAKPGEHPWWHSFTDLVINYLSDYPRSMIFMLWGKHAQAKAKLINFDNNVVLESQHPSPMANASLSEDKRFDKIDHFVFANECLVGYDPGPIDWNPTATTGVFTDGACPGNGQANALAGWGAYFTSGPLKGTKCCGPVSIYTDSDGTVYKRTNNRAEMCAIIEAINIYLENNIKGHLIMYIDNQMCVNIINKWLDSWIKNNLIEERKNPDLLWQMASCLKKLRFLQDDGGFKFEAKHVYAHLEKKGKMPKAGTPAYKIWHNNREADKLANKGVTMCHDDAEESGEKKDNIVFDF